jgi:hypothetical protein
VAWFAHLHKVGSQPTFTPFGEIPPKSHLLVLLGNREDVIVAGKKTLVEFFFRCMKLEELMAGKYFKTLGTCLEVAGTCFTIDRNCDVLPISLEDLLN